MTQTTEKVAATTAPKKTPAKKRVKPQVAKKVEAAPAPKINTHVAAGIKATRYTGPSSFINGNRRVKVQLGGRTEVTDRAAKGLYALRECYGDKPWTPKGFDNGILRRLLGQGLIKASGGTKSTIDGLPYLIDGAQPVSFTITAEGMKHGKA